ncbi:phosphate acetyltransferase [Nocardiopsis sp. MG754419]|uniref:phosphate acetyltransferase n=1 Tax=Nocardiopsis sp. MG754419 TaxID=2259865 RepID=UPI001BA526E5|nr:phosphate acetyltransferase [Nocardiopsis sp. MG754419]MBR8743674.1 phosphate acetyltransferase [Nocardiopsis sp. MG754419]
MTGVYVASSDAGSDKRTVALGMAELLAGTVDTVGVFRPIVAENGRDPLVETLRRRYGIVDPYEDCVGVTYRRVHSDPEEAMAQIVASYVALSARRSGVVVVGTDYTDVGTPTEFAFNARVAANLGIPVMLVVSGTRRDTYGVRSEIAVVHAELAREHATRLTTVVDGVDPQRAQELRDRLDRIAYVLPDVPGLSAPTVRDLQDACEGRLLFGESGRLSRETSGLEIASMSLPGLLDRLAPDRLVLLSADRAGSLLPALLAAHSSPDFPALAGVLLTGDTEMPEPVWRLLTGMNVRLPVLSTPLDTYTAATRLFAVRGGRAPLPDKKIESAVAVFDSALDGPELLARLRVTRSAAVTPVMFEHTLLERARADRRRVVLPEGTDERVLRAADLLRRRDVADLTLLGPTRKIKARADDLGVDLSGVDLIDPDHSELRERFAEEYAALRAHKGATVDLARDTVAEVSYFGTLMVHCGLADGMVSGARHTTAQTIRPSFEILRSGLVSSVFFMCLADRVLVYGDCAVVPDPTAAQLAEIAAGSADTAARFGVDPRVALLSYSTGASGSGAGVDKVREATDLLRAARPDLELEGPIQYDAAIDPAVAHAKLPDSRVAGRATVFVVPDLNTGNTLYKGVQRSAGAVAVGPVLQGLRKPVNDLSRGATVRDIVNTVAITAVQAQEPRT